uniref:Uncharacterized protein n=1 Tax=viral metagenome TaxID=1070528 RepID=A0A6H1Z8W4_9ZZZZ
MPDITCCQGTGCPQKDICQRYLAGIPDADTNLYVHLRWQSWFTEIPYNHELNICEDYWDVNKRREA